jgi:hypothetical protein
MSMSIRVSVAVMVLLLAGALAVIASDPKTEKRTATGPRQPVLVELFTSEGCSSCPPADRLLIKLQQEQPVPEAEIIILGEHVDYWNYIGWTDRFSSPQFSNRQTDYARNFNLGSIYTPQMVVDGREELNGADERAAQRTIMQATESPKAAITLMAKEGVADITVSGINLIRHAKKARLMLAITEDNVVTEVKRGENGGRTLRHAGVVRSLAEVGSFKLDGDSIRTSKPFSLPSDVPVQDLRLVAFLQEDGTRRVLGITSTRLP